MKENNIFTEYSEFHLYNNYSGTKETFACGIELKYILGFIENIKLSKLDFENKNITGMITYNEQIIPIINLHNFLGLKRYDKCNHYIIVDVDNKKFGFGVNYLKKIVKFNTNNIVDPFRILNKYNLIYIKNTIVNNNNDFILIFDFKKISNEII